jgi:hypothetical protein
MERTYNVGPDANTVTMEVNAGTAATCFTAAFQVMPGGQRTLRGESTKAGNGTIKKKTLAKAGELKDTKLVVQTIADFSALPQQVIDAIKTDPHALKTALKLDYTFNGGKPGKQIFDYDFDDYILGSNGKIVVVTKTINLVP